MRARTETDDAAVARALIEVSADGLAVLDANGRFSELNGAGRRILGLGEHDISSVPAPFGSQPHGETEWQDTDGRWHRLEYRTHTLDADRTAVWFADITEYRREQERLSAITRAAASVAASGSLHATLEAMAREVWLTANIAAVQILTIDQPSDELRMVGMAGFGDTTGFTERLSECRALGADVRFTRALETRQPVVVPHRKPVIMRDPRWAPLHQIMGEPDWDSFASMPLIVRGRVLGVINAYYVPGDDPGPGSLAFLSAIADHAAVAVETASLLAQTRSRAQLQERRKLARDLHDSVVQQLFSMGMRARGLRGRLEQPDAALSTVRDDVDELAELTRNALADLRSLVFELHPLELADRGLPEVVRSYAASVQARTGLAIDVHISAECDLGLGVEVLEDLYRIVQEALHNVVKHAHADHADVELDRSRDGGVRLRVTDNGSGRAVPPADGASLGLVSMRERAERWHGAIEAGPRPDGGWSVQVTLPPTTT